MIPFFVADRPISLNILKSSFVKNLDLSFGLMSHAFTSSRFKELFKAFPCQKDDVCWVINKKCSLSEEDLCPEGKMLRNSTTKICDSGVFCKTGCSIDYSSLFKRYEQMDTDYGIMIDVLKDPKATIKSAKTALDTFKKKKYSFKLITVSQGNSIKEYKDCYKKLKMLGSEHIAIGGLLKKRVNSARYVTVHGENFIIEVTKAIRREFNPEWLYVLGSYHPKRHEMFANLGVFGSDYKGWIFNYTHKNTLVNNVNNALDMIERDTIRDETTRAIKVERAKIFEKFVKQQQKYIRTKNTSTENTLLKAKHRAILKRLETKLIQLDTELCSLRTHLVSLDGLPLNYKKAVSKWRALLNDSEIEIRVRGVHDYLGKNVYRLMRDGN